MEQELLKTPEPIEDEWNKAEVIARALAEDVDRNELGKILAYARSVRDTESILDLVHRLPRSGYIRSGRTQGYLQRIDQVLQRELAGLVGERAVLVLAWAFRLMTFYQTQLGTRRASGRQRR